MISMYSGKYNKENCGVNKGYVFNGHVRSLFLIEEDYINPKQEENLYNAIREFRLTGAELSPHQPVPVLLFGYEENGKEGCAYAVANHYFTWKDFIKKSKDPRNIYCLTNSEMVAHAQDIKDYFVKLANRYVRSFKRGQKVAAGGLLLVEQFLNDIAMIYYKLGKGNHPLALTEEYYLEHGTTPADVYERITNFKFRVNTNPEISK